MLITGLARLPLEQIEDGDMNSPLPIRPNACINIAGIENISEEEQDACGHSGFAKQDLVHLNPAEACGSKPRQLREEILGEKGSRSGQRTPEYKENVRTSNNIKDRVLGLRPKASSYKNLLEARYANDVSGTSGRNLLKSILLKLPDINSAKISAKAVDNVKSPLTASPTVKLTPHDFDPLSKLGEGAYGKVILVQRKPSSSFYAMKIIRKEQIVMEKKEKQVFMEKRVLSMLSHPNIIKLKWTFHDKSKLYFVMEYASNGDFQDFLHRQKICSKEITRFYAAELVNVLEYLHKKNVAHRDLKPGNLLLDENYHLKLIDFGTAKVMDEDSPNSANIRKDNTHSDQHHVKNWDSLVGTADYVSPEMLLDQEVGPAADLWALGCIIYQMLTGKTPFKANTEDKTFEHILQQKYEFPPDFPKDAANLVSQLLAYHPQDRLGAGDTFSNSGFEALKKHPFFEGVIFANLENQEPPLDWSSIKRSALKTSILSRGNSARKLFESIDSAFNTPKSSTSAMSSSNKSGGSDALDFGSASIKFLDSIDESATPKNIKKKSQFSHPSTRACSRKSSLSTETIVLKTDMIKVKRGWFRQSQRVLALTNNPRLFVINPDNQSIMKRIQLNHDTRVIKQSNNRLQIINHNEKFTFKLSNERMMDEWFELINFAVMKYF